ncbi:unnamed protein product [Lymnaea stagnalis]|uniref:Uncharacterized protein n=1 Tax=Lymnaea stagnalis TaxID=6523 RepID=A0AAV2HKT6_LYMST
MACSNYFKEKCILDEERKALTSMLNLFQDQLNRLKVEELALLSRIKMDASKEPVDTKSESASASSVIPFSLATTSSHPISFENTDEMNMLSLNLNVDRVPELGVARRNNDYEEEEEEDDDDDDDYEMDEAEADDYDRKLRSFMD